MDHRVKPGGDELEVAHRLAASGRAAFGRICNKGHSERGDDEK